MLAGRREVLARLPETRAVLTNEQGAWIETGELIRQPALAATLRAVADECVAHVYEGAWAERFVAAVQAEGGVLSMDDMRAYEAVRDAPLRADFGAYELVSQPAPAHGGVNLVEALGVLERAQLVAPHASCSAAH